MLLIYMAIHTTTKKFSVGFEVCGVFADGDGERRDKPGHELTPPGYSRCLQTTEKTEQTCMRIPQRKKATAASLFDHLPPSVKQSRSRSGGTAPGGPVSGPQANRRKSLARRRHIVY